MSHAASGPEATKAPITAATAIDAIGQAVIATDAEGTIVLWNRIAEKLYGWPADEVLGRNILDVTPGTSSRTQAKEILRRLYRGDTWHGRFSVRRRDGTHFTADVSDYPILDADGTLVGIVGVSRSLTETAALETARDAHVAQLDALGRAAIAINSEVALEPMLRAVTERAREIIGANMARTSLTADGESLAQRIAHVSLSDDYDAYRGYDAVPDGSGIYHLVCQENRAMRLTQAELEAHPAWQGFSGKGAHHPPLSGWLAAPLVGSDGRNLGVIQLSDKRDGQFNSTDEALLSQLAQVASVAIERVDALAAAEARAEQLAALSEQLVAIQEQERRDVARELHEECGQALTALKLNLDLVAQDIPPPARARLNEARTQIRQLTDYVRDRALDLRPAMLDDLGLEPTLRWLVRRLTDETGPDVRLQIAIRNRRFSSALETAVYRIVQQALIAAKQQLAAEAVDLQLYVHDDTLLLVGDASVPTAWQQEVPANKLTLLAMTERAKMIGGEIELNCRVEGHVQLLGTFPCDRRAAATNASGKPRNGTAR